MVPKRRLFPNLTPGNLFMILLAIWAVWKILQSCFTEILADEAYYAMYAKYLDWGYFDHPPMVALFIKLGSFIRGELGTRLFAVIAQIIELVLLWKIIDEPHPSKGKVLLFFGIAASVVMFQVYGFVITPDAPLLFFTTLFLFLYKRFLQKQNISLTLALGVAMAGMIYSKYHALLVIALVVVSNPRLLTNWRLYVSGMITLLLLIPHIHWQVVHDFPSFSYHMIDRSDGFRFFYLIEFWLNQLVVFNPVMFVLSIFILFKYKPEDLFERSLYFITGGFIVFFFLTAFRGHVEPHWTITACLPMIILLYKYCVRNIKIRKITYRFILPVIAILLVLSTELIFNFSPLNFGFHGNRQFAAGLSEIVQEKPLLFQNSYQKASLYTYYSGKPALSLNNSGYRQNQYDIWNFDESLYRQPVILVTGSSDTLSRAYNIGKDTYWLHDIQSFMPVSRIKIDFNLPDKIFQEGEKITIPVTVTNPYPFEIDFQHPELPLAFNASLAKRKKRWRIWASPSEKIGILQPGAGKILDITFVMKGNGEKEFQAGIGLATPYSYPAFNSKFQEIKMED